MNYEIMTCKEYNARQKIKYNKRVAEWSKENSNNIIPQIAFFYFWDSKNNLRENGFVKIEGNREVWAKTKKELLLTNK